jgi:hypothetical protein
VGIKLIIPDLDLAVAYRTELLNDAMVQFENGSIIRSVLTGANATIQFSGEKKIASTRPRNFF